MEIFKVWVVKFALTQGIQEKEAEICEHIDKNMISIIPRKFGGEHYFKGQWYTTKEEAIKKAEEMRNKKIKNLEKQIEKLKNIQFN